MRLPGRFEWKILGGPLLVALLSLGVAWIFIQDVINHFTGYTLLHQNDVQQSLGTAIRVFEAYFAERKSPFSRRAQAIAEDPPPELSLLAGDSDLLSARLLESDHVVDEWHAARAEAARLAAGPPIPVAVPGTEPP